MAVSKDLKKVHATLQRMTAYIELAKDIAEHPNHTCYVCTDINYRGKLPEFKLFKPTKRERNALGYFGMAWFSESNALYQKESESIGNMARIIALLLCHEICCDVCNEFIQGLKEEKQELRRMMVVSRPQIGYLGSQHHVYSRQLESVNDIIKQINELLK